MILDEFILRALIAGIGVALVTGALGCFVVWRRMAYFGDSLAHSALLGVALGLLWNISLNLGILLICSGFAVLLVWLQQKRILAMDTLLGILAHAGLAMGIVTISLLNITNFDMHSFLFGDILTVSWQDIYWVYGGGACILFLLIWRWSALTLMTIHEDLARAEGVHVWWHHLLLMFLMTLVVAISLQMVGILLITSMLIIPAASARQFAKSPEAMAFFSAGLGVLSVLLGMAGSVTWDTPSGPSIVTAAFSIFVAVFLLKLTTGLKYIQSKQIDK